MLSATKMMNTGTIPYALCGGRGKIDEKSTNTIRFLAADTEMTEEAPTRVFLHRCQHDLRGRYRYDEKDSNTTVFPYRWSWPKWWETRSNTILRCLVVDAVKITMCVLLRPRSAAAAAGGEKRMICEKSSWPIFITFRVALSLSPTNSVRKNKLFTISENLIVLKLIRVKFIIP